jgi:hypothetical protein
MVIAPALGWFVSPADQPISIADVSSATLSVTPLLAPAPS